MRKIITFLKKELPCKPLARYTSEIPLEVSLFYATWVVSHLYKNKTRIYKSQTIITADGSSFSNKMSFFCSATMKGRAQYFQPTNGSVEKIFSVSGRSGYFSPKDTAIRKLFTKYSQGTFMSMYAGMWAHNVNMIICKTTKGLHVPKNENKREAKKVFRPWMGHWSPEGKENNTIMLLAEEITFSDFMKANISQQHSANTMKIVRTRATDK